ncbi:hypothetical protein PC115_g17482 [Phytophthora cactorum]|uniref:Uncharacterized protein n=1 Tax=Phytophthora cactorum TaxID=29920 RepID=A0A8T1B9E7_9STRA|nr:hypothetical protein PC115_g17482 [Phytophthora cactorum]
MFKATHAATARDSKKAKAAEAATRAEAPAARRSAEKARERVRMADEEDRWAEARQQALDSLAVGKRKAYEKPPAAKKRKKVSRHITEADEDGDFDDESGPDAAGCVEFYRSPASQPSRPQTSRVLRMETTESAQNSVSNEVAAMQDDDNGALNSDCDGDGRDSVDWYVEEDGFSAESPDIAQAFMDARGMKDNNEDGLSNDRDGGLDGVAILNHQKKRTQKQLQREGLKAAIQTLPRDYSATNYWDTFTKDEMQVLEQDEKALKKVRVDGWEFGEMFEHVVYTTFRDQTHSVCYA